LEPPPPNLGAPLLADATVLVDVAVVLAVLDSPWKARKLPTARISASTAPATIMIGFLLSAAAIRTVPSISTPTEDRARG
jgi:hypothetical protein